MFTSEYNKKVFIEISNVIKIVQDENNSFFKKLLSTLCVIMMHPYPL